MTHWFRFVYTARDADCAPDADDLVRDASDVLDRLNGRPPSLDRCRRAIGVYLAAPSPQTLARLRDAYGAIPRQFRRYLFNVDAKDHPVRALLGAATEEDRAKAEARLREEWEYDRMAEQYGPGAST